MRGLFVLLGLAGLSILVPRAVRAQAPEPTPIYRYSVRAIDTAPPPTIPPPIAPTPVRSPGAVAAAITPPRFDLVWSTVLDRAVADFRSLTEVSADTLSAILQPGPTDTLIPAHPDPFVPSGTPPEVPTGVRIGLTRLQPIAVITPAPSGTEIPGQAAVLPGVVIELPWMIP